MSEKAPIPPEQMAEYVRKINERLPVHAMWDGYWIESFKRSNLQISGSLDRLYYREWDIVFKKVTFFNLPAEWRDTNIIGNDFFCLSSKEEFKLHHPDFDPGDHHIFAIDLWYPFLEPTEKHTFFVVAANVFLFKCESPDTDVWMNYTDPLLGGYKEKRNRVPFAKGRHSIW